MLIADDGTVAVTQGGHAEMCRAIGEAWGNDEFGAVEPVVLLAAEQHELGWAELDAAPPLDERTGAPLTVGDMHFSRYIHAQIEGPRALAPRDPHAALLASLHHVSLYSRPGPVGLLSRDGRRLRDFFARSEELQGALRAIVDASDERIEREWRLVRAWDGLSHDLLLDRAPCDRPRVPTADGTLVTLRLERDGDAITVDPWPFRSDAVEIPVRGRRLDDGRWSGDASEVTLTYALRRDDARAVRR